jgi:Protein kinase domain
LWLWCLGRCGGESGYIGGSPQCVAQLFLAMDLIENGELYSYVNEYNGVVLPEPVVRFYFRWASARTHTHAHTHTHKLTNTQTHTQTHTHKHARTHKHTHKRTHKLTNTHKHTSTRAHTHINTGTHTTHTHTHKQTHTLTQPQTRRTHTHTPSYQNVSDSTHMRGLPAHRQLVSALEYCHARGVVHGDVKLEHMLLDREGSLKLAEFMRSRVSVRSLRACESTGPDSCRPPNGAGEAGRWFCLTACVSWIGGAIPGNVDQDDGKPSHVRAGGTPGPRRHGARIACAYSFSWA